MLDYKLILLLLIDCFSLNGCFCVHHYRHICTYINLKKINE